MTPRVLPLPDIAFAALNRASVNASALVRGLSSALTSANATGNPLADYLADALATAESLVQAIAAVRDPADLELALVLPLKLTKLLDRADAVSTRPAHGDSYGPNFVLADARARAGALEHALHMALSAAHAAESSQRELPGGKRAGEELLDHIEQRPGAPVSRTAEGLLRTALKWLPAEHRGRYAEEFGAEQRKLSKPLRQVLYALRQMRHVLQLRAALLNPDQPSRLHRAACWILASEWRTWGLLGPLMACAIVNVFLQQGWGSAFFTIPAVVAFYVGVEWLRGRWDVEVKRRSHPGRNSASE